MEKEIHVECPNCKNMILIMSTDINCAIFRHGAYKSNMAQINPHESKEVCDSLFNENKIYGCGKPFKLLSNENNYLTEMCDYL